jgi:hypothetical protein
MKKEILVKKGDIPASDMSVVIPLNFDVDVSSKDRLEQVFNDVEPATPKCGLCKLVFGDG